MSAYELEKLGFPGSFNGLQIDKVGKVSKIGAAVDAGLIPLKKRQRIRSISWSFIMNFWSPYSSYRGKFQQG